MKIDLFSIGSFTVHGYGLMIAIGVLACVIMGTYRAKKKDMNPESVIDITIISVLLGFVGAKLLYVIVEFKTFLVDPFSVLGGEGFVVYGGIIAGVLAAMVYCRIKKLVFLEYFDLLAPSIAIAQGFGRIGCFLAGCCYGHVTDGPLGVMFPDNSLAPSGVKVLPTQMFSAAGDFLIMAILLVFARKSKHKGQVGAMYLLLYGVGRFMIEFLRGDERGGILGLSTSQFISIFIVIFAVGMIAVVRRPKTETDTPSE